MRRKLAGSLQAILLSILLPVGARGQGGAVGRTHGAQRLAENAQSLADHISGRAVLNFGEVGELVRGINGLELPPQQLVEGSASALTEIEAVLAVEARLARRLLSDKDLESFRLSEEERRAVESLDRMEDMGLEFLGRLMGQPGRLLQLKEALELPRTIRKLDLLQKFEAERRAFEEGRLLPDAAGIAAAAPVAEYLGPSRVALPAAARLKPSPESTLARVEQLGKAWYRLSSPDFSRAERSLFLDRLTPREAAALRGYMEDFGEGKVESARELATAWAMLKHFSARHPAPGLADLDLKALGGLILRLQADRRFHDFDFIRNVIGERMRSGDWAEADRVVDAARAQAEAGHLSGAILFYGKLLDSPGVDFGALMGHYSKIPGRALDVELMFLGYLWKQIDMIKVGNAVGRLQGGRLSDIYGNNSQDGTLKPGARNELEVYAAEMSETIEAFSRLRIHRGLTAAVDLDEILRLLARFQRLHAEIIASYKSAPAEMKRDEASRKAKIDELAALIAPGGTISRALFKGFERARLERP